MVGVTSKISFLNASRIAEALRTALPDVRWSRALSCRPALPCWRLAVLLRLSRKSEDHRNRHQRKDDPRAPESFHVLTPLPII
jgi:hypothetical protein